MKQMIPVTVLLMASSLAADPGTGPATPTPTPTPTPTLSEIVAQYNARVGSPPVLTVSTAAPEDDYAPQSATVPGWVDGLAMSQAELRALAATVGVYAASPAFPPRDKPSPSPIAVAGGVALAMLANDADRRLEAHRRGNTISAERNPAAVTGSFAALPPPPAKDLFPGRLIAFDTCGGAFFAALTRLNQTQPASPFTAFVRSVGGTAFAGPVRADPTCGGKNEAAGVG